MIDNEDFSSLTNIRSAMNDMLSIENFDKEYKEIASSLSDSYYILEETSKKLDTIIENLDFDGNRLMQVESRLDMINSITRKYGGSVNDVLEYFDNIVKEYQMLTGSNSSSNDLEKELKDSNESKN